MATLTYRTLLIGALALAVGCSEQTPRADEKVEASPTPAPQPTVAPEQAPRAVEKAEVDSEKSTARAPFTEDDFKILDVVLLDLLDFEEFMPSNPPRSSWTRKRRVASTTFP